MQAEAEIMAPATPTPSTTGEVAPARAPDTIKVKTPDTFDGTRQNLRMFLGQVELYIGFNASKFVYEVNKVMYAGTFLRGPAFDWFEPILTDYQNNMTIEGKVTKGARLFTQEVCVSFATFKKKLQEVFGDIDEKHLATQRLLSLRQRTSAAAYHAEFQQHSAKVQWGDEALMARFYDGLKDRVKDDMARGDRPDDLKEMVETAIRIDNRLYERHLEKKGVWKPNFEKRNKVRWPQPMELDATGGKLRPQERERRFKEKLCFQCGKPGHIARDCGENKGRFRKQNAKRQAYATNTGRKSGPRKGQIYATGQGKVPTGLDENRLDEESQVESSGDWEHVFHEGLEKALLGDKLDSSSEDSDWNLDSPVSAEFLTPEERKERVELIRETNQLTWKKQDLDARWAQQTKENILRKREKARIEAEKEEQERALHCMAVNQAHKEMEQRWADKQRRLEDPNNVARTDHPRHAELAWSACYTKECRVHLDAKTGANYFPRRREAVFWPEESVDERQPKN